MMRGHRSSRRNALWLSVLCVLLLAVVATELGEKPPVTAPSAPPAASPPPPASADVAGFTMPPESAFAEVVERPLFSATRRPPSASAAAAAAAAATTQGDLVLVGIITSSAERYALIQHGKPTRVDRVAENDALGGWTVESIERDRVILHTGDRRLELSTNDQLALGSRQPSGNTGGASTNLTSVPDPARE
jgi:hypothetical protein